MTTAPAANGGGGAAARAVSGAAAAAATAAAAPSGAGGGGSAAPALPVAIPASGLLRAAAQAAVIHAAAQAAARQAAAAAAAGAGGAVGVGAPGRGAGAVADAAGGGKGAWRGGWTAVVRLPSHTRTHTTGTHAPRLSPLVLLSGPEHLAALRAVIESLSATGMEELEPPPVGGLGKGGFTRMFGKAVQDALKTADEVVTT